MKIAAPTIGEGLRIKDLLSYSILDSEKEKDYDDLVELASQICDCPIALITFVDDERQWFKASKNLEAPQTTRDVAFCSHTILQNDVMVVTDARTDERFFDNPLVTGDLQIGFYAGAPILSSSGYNLGSVCVIDQVKKDELSPQQKNSLTIIARQVSKLLELRVKNKLVTKHVEAQIEAEKRISRLIIAESDKKDNLIAYELHENLAQTLAATKLLLNSATDSKDLQPYFLEKSKEAISFLIDEIKSLSKSIIPTTFQNADYYWIIHDYGMQFGKLNNIQVDFGKHEAINSKKSNIGLNLFRIVQHLLEISKIMGADKISIDIMNNHEIKLDYRDNVKIDKNDFLSSELLNNIITRVELLNGKLTLTPNSKGNAVLIHLPGTAIKPANTDA
ncbi:MAG: GAF domain-containing protein [Ferruginibacter sp.]|nr:GAF domain-containing protein [Ferruginibacter sp.]